MAIDEPELAPFSTKRMEQLQSVSDLESIILERGLHLEVVPELAIGQLMSSAIIFGALLEQRRWDNCVASLLGGVRAIGDMFWIEFECQEAGGAFRWYPDPISEALIRRWRRAGGTLPQSYCVRHCIEQYLRKLGIIDAPEIALEIEHLATMRWRLRMPSILVEAASGRIDWRSLGAADWRDLVTSHVSCSPSLPSFTNTEESAISTADESNKRPANWVPAYPIARALAEASYFDVASRRMRWLKKADGRTKCLPAVKRCVRSRTSGSFIETTLNSWVFRRLAPWSEEAESDRQRPLSPSWLWQQLRRIEPAVTSLERLGGFTGNRLTTQAIASTYRSAIRSESCSRKRARLLYALADFQDELEARRPDICVLFDEYDDVVFREENVSSHVISPAVYSAARDELSGPERESRMQRLYLMLGYRAGLRRAEAEALLISDFYLPGDQIELRVRKNPHFTLKTPSARRRIPLQLLLSPEEQGELKTWLTFRERECSGFTEHALLFAKRMAPCRKVEPKNLDVPVVQILRRLSGNPEIVYHHLRHSFATYALATLLLPSDWIEAAVPGLSPDVVSLERRKSLLPGLAGPGSSGQFSVDALGIILGHRSNRTTLLWYMHLLDWVLGQHVRRASSQTGMSAEALASLTGVSAASIRRRSISDRNSLSPARPSRGRGRRRAGDYDPGTAYLDDFSRDVRRKWPIAELTAADRPGRCYAPSCSPNTLDDGEHWRAHAGALYAMDRGVLPATAAKQFGLTEHDCKALADHADELTRLVTFNKRRRFRFAGWLDAPNRERAEAPGIRLVHRGWKRRSEQTVAELSSFSGRTPERARSVRDAFADVRRMDELWPRMRARANHARTHWLLRSFLTGYSEPRALMPFRSANRAARYASALLTLGVPIVCIRIRSAAMLAWLNIASQLEVADPSIADLKEIIERQCGSESGYHLQVVRQGMESACPAVPYLLLLLAALEGRGSDVERKYQDFNSVDRFKPLPRERYVPPRRSLG